MKCPILISQRHIARSTANFNFLARRLLRLQMFITEWSLKRDFIALQKKWYPLNSLSTGHWDIHSLRHKKLAQKIWYIQCVAVIPIVLILSSFQPPRWSGPDVCALNQMNAVVSCVCIMFAPLMIMQGRLLVLFDFCVMSRRCHFFLNSDVVFFSTVCFCCVWSFLPALVI